MSLNPKSRCALGIFQNGSILAGAARQYLLGLPRFMSLYMYIHRLQEKSIRQNVFVIFYKTRPILIIVGPEHICYRVLKRFARHMYSVSTPLPCET